MQDISRSLSYDGKPVSRATVARILKEEGFARLPRQDQGDRVLLPRSYSRGVEAHLAHRRRDPVARVVAANSRLAGSTLSPCRRRRESWSSTSATSNTRMPAARKCMSARFSSGLAARGVDITLASTSFPGSADDCERSGMRIRRFGRIRYYYPRVVMALRERDAARALRCRRRLHEQAAVPVAALLRGAGTRDRPPPVRESPHSSRFHGRSR